MPAQQACGAVETCPPCSVPIGREGGKNWSSEHRVTSMAAPLAGARQSTVYPRPLEGDRVTGVAARLAGGRSHPCILSRVTSMAAPRGGDESDQHGRNI